LSAKRILLYLILAGLLVRVVYLGEVSALPFFHDPVGDSARYLDRAREIAAGDMVGDRPFFYGGIFYPYMIALDLAVFGKNLYPICLAQAVAGCALAWIIHALMLAGARPGSRTPIRAAAVVAAALALFYGPFAFLEADLLMISWTLLLLMSAALLLVRAAGDEARKVRGRRIAWIGMAGLCLGLAASERPNMVALLPVLSIWVALYVPAPSRLPGMVALLAGGGVVLAGVAAINHAASGRWIPLTTSSGINFYIGNNPGARGTFDEPWSTSDTRFTARFTDLEESSLVMARKLSGRDLDGAGASAYWFGRGLSWLREHPAAAARVWLRKVLLFWNAVEIPNHLNYAFMRSVAPALRLMPIGFFVVGPLALYGFLAAGSRRMLAGRTWVLLAALVLVPMLTVMPFFVADRYRIVAVPPLIVAAACGLTSLVSALADPTSRRRALGGLAVIGAAGLLVSLPLTDFGTARDHWLMAQAWKKEGNLPEAVRHYEEALEQTPRDAAIRNNLGVALAGMGEADRAEEAYRTAIDDDPALVFPRKNLGLLLLRQGRPDEAFTRLREAEAMDPDDPDTERGLAVLFMARGQADEAIARARMVLAREPDDRTARELLARAEAEERGLKR